MMRQHTRHRHDNVTLEKYVTQLLNPPNMRLCI
jgi:hypothetical protein